MVFLGRINKYPSGVEPVIMVQEILVLFVLFYGLSSYIVTGIFVNMTNSLPLTKYVCNILIHSKLKI